MDKIRLKTIKKKKKGLKKNNQDTSQFSLQVHEFILAMEKETRYIIHKIKVRISIYVGYLIYCEEIKRDQKFNLFWKSVSLELQKLGCCLYSRRSALFEAKRLYLAFKRFTFIFEGSLAVENIRIPDRITKGHLLLVAHYCHAVDQQDFFITKIISQGINKSDLKKQLIAGTGLLGPNDFFRIDDLIIKRSYDLRCLGIDRMWNENKIKKHILNNMVRFINLVFVVEGWVFIEENKLCFGGRKKYLDLVFYNTVYCRYVIIDLKCSCLVAELDRAKSQIVSYVKAYDEQLDLRFCQRTVGLVLGKEPIDCVYFNSSGCWVDNIFYSGFRI